MLRKTKREWPKNCTYPNKLVVVQPFVSKLSPFYYIKFLHAVRRHIRLLIKYRENKAIRLDTVFVVVVYLK